MTLLLFCYNFENAFLYAFSTIPQVIAAIVALLAVFLLFKIQSIKSTIIGFGRETVYYFENLSSFKIEANSNDIIKESLEKLRHTITREDLVSITEQVSNISNELNNVEKRTPKSEMRKFNSIKRIIKNNNQIQKNCLGKHEKLINKSRFVLIQTILIILITVIMISIIPVIIIHGVAILYIIFVLSVLWLSFVFYRIYEIIDIAFVKDE